MSDENTEQQTRFSFGKRFSTARGALNLSREEVARELKLGIEIVIALEDEDYDQLAAPIYVTGYIRNYARLLRIPVEPLLAAYNQVQVERPQIVASAIPKSGPSYSRWLIKLVSIVIVLVLVAGLVSWFQSQNFEPSSWFSAPEKAPGTEPELSLPELAEPDDSPEVVAEEAGNKPDATEAVTEPAAAPLEPIISAPLAAEPVKAPVEAVKNEIILRLTSDSWVDIKDSAGKRLIYDLIRAGKEKRVTGQPPFKVFLGNAKGVRIEYNGKPFNVEKHRRGKLARFRIGNTAE